ncbi:glycosyltransferase family 2 protein [Candidatus Parabeggiatoa sp. HSG14]|uniref:glycosyltransferase family 2 protein n=1 Tax=Candidatus Parabeggiatoa sp. HSG14 TaxID=3055593 RepID=UPI0025A90DE2|nr:glycosyltransferase family 2 protein [Thiotrichales bacterium HSG14]
MTSQNKLNHLLESCNYFSPNTVINFSDHDLTPVASLSSEQDIHREVEISIPLLCGKKVQWFLDCQSHEKISALFLKLGAGGRVNHCQVELSLWQAQTMVAKTSLDGPLVQDNQWTQFVFNPPINPGKYLCQLLSPDADNDVNTLFVWLTVAKPKIVLIPENLFEPYYYGSIPIMSLSSEQISHREIETTLPILGGKKILQWPFEWQSSEAISSLFLKLGTGGKTNLCQLVLSILQEQKNGLTTIIAKANVDGPLIQDAQWTEFVLDYPIKQGHYLCQLYSPDIDSSVNALFIWLTVAQPELAQLKVHDLYYYSLTPLLKFSLRQTYHKNIETSVPLLHNQIVQWPVNWQRSKAISSIFLKLGTGGRINQCQLVLSILQEHENNQKTLVATAHRKGSTIQDNEWTEFVFDHSIESGNYLCQLHSPNTDDTNDALFLGLTVAKQGLINYCYVVPSPLNLSKKLDRLKQFPIISIIISITGKNNLSHLRDCLNSVINQVYPHWELCIVTQVASVNDSLFEEYHRLFPHKIKFIYGQLNQTTSRLYNMALEWVTGQYTVFLQPEDLLCKDTLLEVAKRIHQSVDTIDMLYTDEDKVSEKDLFEEPYFKPDWAVDMLKGQHYTGQLGVYRTHLLEEIGGFREALYDQELWDMVLRFTEKSNHIQHIPKILYHSRWQPLVSTHKNLLLKILQEALNREGQEGRVALNTTATNTCLIHYPVKAQPLVSIIIPTKDMASMLAQCIESIRAITTYPHWEIIIVDNGSQETATFELFEKYQAKLGDAFTVSRHDIPFNFAKLVNHGVNTAKGEIILLLNNDTEILGPSDWLQEMIGFAQHPEIACVGCKLLYPQDNTIQHAGLICGVGGIANHGHKHFPAKSTGYFNRLATVANYSAITGACLMIRRELWGKVKGFDENLAIAFNDVDFCLKLLKKNFRHVVLPQVTFHHYESKTRGLEDTSAKKERLHQEEVYMKQRWGSVLENDPFYNPHLTKKTENFTLNQESIYYCVDWEKLL